MLKSIQVEDVEVLLNLRDVFLPQTELRLVIIKTKVLRVFLLLLGLFLI